MVSVILKACLNGARLPSEHPSLPTTPTRLAADAVAARAAGADAIHLHVKDAAGRDTLAAEPLAETLAAVRHGADGLPVGVTTGAWTEPDPHERVARIRRWGTLPDFASVNWHEDGADDVASALIDIGVGVEAGLCNAEAVARWTHSPHRTRCLRILIELPAESDPVAAHKVAEEMLDAVAEANDTHIPVLLHGEDSSTWRALEFAVRRGLSARIGLEDTLQLPDGRRAPDNRALLRAARNIVQNELESLRGTS